MIEAEDKKFKKETESLKVHLPKALVQFEKCHDWAEFGNWLAKIAGIFKDFPTPFIPEKQILAKRLSQCLHPQLPHGVHMNALKVYEIVFSALKLSRKPWSEDLAIFSTGLFPFFHYASFQVKPEIIKIYRDYYLGLKKQLIPCLPGLVVSILPGLEEQNEELQKSVYKLLDDLTEAVGRKHFLGCLWMGLLRYAKIRLPALKYISKRLKVKKIKHDGDDDDEEQHIEKDIDIQNLSMHMKQNISVRIEPRDPSDSKNRMTLTQNEQNKGLTGENAGEDSNYLEQKKKLLEAIDDEDFAENPLDIEYPNKSTLVINALIACLDDENVMVKRAVLDFMKSSIEVAHNEFFAKNELIVLIEAALSQLIKKENSVMRRIYTWLFGPPDNENKYQISENNKIVQEYLIEAFKSIFARIPLNQAEGIFPLKVIQTFYMEHDHLIDITLGDLGVPIIEYIYAHTREASFASEIFKSGERFLENIPSQFGILLKSLADSVKEKIEKNKINSEVSDELSESDVRSIELIDFTFEKLLNKENLYPEVKIEYIKLLLTGILGSLSNINTLLVDIIDNTSKKKTDFYLKSFELCEKFFLNLSNLNKKIYSELPSEEKSEIKKNFSAEVLRYLKTFHFISKTFAELSYNVDAENEEAKDDELYQKLPKVSKESVEFFKNASNMAVYSLHYLPEDYVIESLPDWFLSLFNCSKTDDVNIASIAIESIVLMFSFENDNANYKKLKELTGSYVGSKNHDKFNKNEHILIRTIISQLWILLDYSAFQAKVIQLLDQLFIHFDNLFSECVSMTLSFDSVQDKEKAIQRYATFWKLTSDNQKYHEFYTKSFGLLKMLDFLDNENPLLRHASKSWLIESSYHFSRIVDPLLRVFLEGNEWYITQSGQIFYSVKYDTARVSSTFKRIKNVLQIANEIFLRFIQKPIVNDSLKDLALILNDSELLVGDYTYCDLLITICLRYIQGQALESFGTQFYSDNLTINACACEFLELILKRVDDKNYAAKASFIVLQPLLICLAHAIRNKDFVMQIQILSLLQTVLFQSPLISNENYKQASTSIIEGKIFLSNLLSGLKINNPYIIIQYTQFITKCLPILTQFMDEGSKKNLTPNIQSILLAYYQHITAKEIEVFLGDDDDIEIDALASTELGEIHNFMNKEVQHKTEEENKGLIYVGGSKGRNLQSYVPVFLEGIKQILKYFLKIKTDSKIDFVDTEAENSLSFINRVTFGVFNIREVEKEKLYFEEFHETCESIILDTTQLISVFKHCWKVSKDFKNLIDMTSYGVSPYTYDKYNNYNKNIKNVIDEYTISHPRTLKQQILSMLQPLIYKFPDEIFGSFVDIWLRDCQAREYPPKINLNQELSKLIEMLVTVNIPADYFLKLLRRNQKVHEIDRLIISKILRHGGSNVLNYGEATQEAQILYFAYSYLSLVHLKIEKKDFLMNFWTNMISLIKVFDMSNNPSTILWCLEIYYLASCKYSPKDILSDNRIRKDLHDSLCALLINAAMVAAKSFNIFFQDKSSESSNYLVVFPINPLIFVEIMDCKKNEHKNDEESEFLKIMFNWESVTEGEIYAKYRFYSFRTLRKIGLPLLQNTYSQGKDDRIVVRTRAYISQILPLFKDKSEENRLVVDRCSEIIHELLRISPNMIKEFKPNILEIFDAVDFFKCSKITLRYFGKIIDAVVSYKGDKENLFDEFLNKVQLNSFFQNKAAEIKQNIKSFQRICFVIFSGQRDKYKNKLKKLLEKIMEVIKDPNAHPNLIILVLFCFRILILRFSAQTLNELFRNIWATLLSLLISIFDPKKYPLQKNLNLIFSALKLIEIISVVQLEEFYIHQWIFVYDYFGVNIINPLESSKEKNEIEEDQNRLFVPPSPFDFVPYGASTLPENCQFNYINKPTQTGGQHLYLKKKRNIILTQESIEDEAALRNLAQKFMIYLIELNEHRCQSSLGEIESVIEGDFIALESFILTLKN